MAESNKSAQQTGTQHLALVRALSRELSTAISAIEQNNVGLLTSSVAAQEAICQQLHRQGSDWLRTAWSEYRASAQPQEDPSILSEIRSAHAALARLNQIYSDLVRRSQKSIQLIAAFYKGHGQSYGDTAKDQAGDHTWSCEV